ncbi:MAG: site-specific DNA-methyltransferase [Catenulispora sp.]|nr:site-specific DNA-methyltransferase [Catenulispora sp.]NUR61445.1 site-specific DNA-methyltransferase [Catenulispora sp.]
MRENTCDNSPETTDEIVITDPDSIAAVQAAALHSQRGSVWLTAQQNSRSQRSGRYVPESVAHPAKMLPEIVRHAICQYTDPGDLVVDPMCGIGTTLVEAMHLGRRGVGTEYEARWTALAEANIALARSQNAPGDATVFNADARQILAAVPAELHGTAALVITSPPYGASLHGQVKPTAETGRSGVQKFDYKYSTDKGNLAHLKVSELIDGFAQILSGCRELLRPGGVVVITTRPWREHGELVDLPGEVIAAGVRAGLVPIERCVALLGGIRDGQFIARPSFFQLANIRKERAAGVLQACITHEDVIVLQRPREAPALEDRVPCTDPLSDTGEPDCE